MDSTLWVVIGVVGLFVTVLIVTALLKKRSLTALLGAGRHSPLISPVKHDPVELEGDFDWDENTRGDIRLLSTVIIDRHIVVSVAHLLVCYHRYREEVPVEYDRCCVMVAEAAYEWIRELRGKALGGDVAAFDQLAALSSDVLPDDPELYMPSGVQPQMTAYEAFVACGMDDMLGAKGR